MVRGGEAKFTANVWSRIFCIFFPKFLVVRCIEFSFSFFPRRKRFSYSWISNTHMYVYSLFSLMLECLYGCILALQY